MEYFIGGTGVLLRGYAKEELQVVDVVSRLVRSANQAHVLGLRSVVLVPSDKDCGGTAEKVTPLLPEGTIVMDPFGDENSDVLNVGLDILRLLGLKRGLIMSNKAVAYLTPRNLAKMHEAFVRGALVAGLAVRDDKVSPAEDDMYQGVLQGRVTNTFALWERSVLCAVGDFDSKIGVEEIAPLTRLAQKHGRPFIAPIIPAGESGLDVSEHRLAQHQRIMTTKMQRQLAEAERAGGTFELIESMILPGYPK